MSVPARSVRRWAVAALGLLVAGLLLLLWLRTRGGDAADAAGEPTPGGGGTASIDPTTPATTDQPRPEVSSAGEPGEPGRPERLPHEGLDPRDVPEPLGIATIERPENTDVSPEFRLDKTARMLTLLQERATRLEGQLAEAERAGDADAAARHRVMLQRVKARVEAVREELEAARAGQPRPSASAQPGGS